MEKQRIKTDKLGRRLYSKSERKKLVRKYQKSGMSQVAFSKAHDLMNTTLSGWIRSLCRSKKKEIFPVEFAEVELPPPVVSEITAELVYPDGRVLHLWNVQATEEHASFIRRVASC